MLKNTIAKNTARMTALTAEYSRQTAEFFHQTSTLTAENHNLNRRLESVESVGENESSIMERRMNINICEKKRSRSASF